MTHIEPLQAMRRHGVQTVQAPVSTYMANNRFEVVDFRHGDFNSTTGGELHLPLTP